MNKPSISVIIPLFNKEATIEKAVSSVLNQSFTDFELIVIDDGSTDNSISTIKQTGGNRIIIVSQQNGGVSAARNRGIQEAQSDLIAFLDADDEWTPSHLSDIINLRKNHPECEVFATRYLRGTEDNSTTPCRIHGLHPEWSGVMENYFHIATRSEPPIHSSSVAITKSALDSIGGFPLGITVGEDLLTWARLALKYKIAYHMKPTSVFRQMPADCSRDIPPSREPDDGDPVGRALNDLIADCPTDKLDDFRKYIAMWHKMRASMYMRMGRSSNALLEARTGLNYHPFNLKLIIYSLLAILPAAISGLILKTASSDKRI